MTGRTDTCGIRRMRRPVMVFVVSALALCYSAHGQQAWQLDSFGDQPTATVPTREQLSEVKVDPATRQQVRLLDEG